MTTIYRDAATMHTLTVADEVELPANSIPDRTITTTAASRIDAEKVEHQRNITWSTATPSTTVASVTTLLHLANADGTIEQITVRPEVIPSGDYQYTVDIQKAADASGSPATVSAAVVTISSSETNYTRKNVGSITTTTFAKGDAFYLVVTASGSSGSQGTGATILLLLNEHAQA